MVEEKASKSENGANAPSFNLQRVYLKDLSVEIPHAPGIFLDNTPPKLEFQVDNWVVSLQGEKFAVSVAADANGSTVAFEDGASLRVEGDWTPGMMLADMTVDGAPLVMKVGKITGGFRIRNRGADLKVHVRSPRQAELALHMIEKLPPDTSKMLLCPMPGLIVKVDVEVGQEVQEGQALCTVEAMKMENILRAERKGVVSKINAAAGDSLAVDDIIMEFE